MKASFAASADMLIPWEPAEITLKILANFQGTRFLTFCNYIIAQKTYPANYGEFSRDNEEMVAKFLRYEAILQPSHIVKATKMSPKGTHTPRYKI